MDGQLSILRSDGGLASAAGAAAAPVNLLLSGPAGGVTGAIWVAEQAGFRDFLTFDMGGTSTDVALVQDLRPADRPRDAGRRPERPLRLGGRTDGRRRRRLDRARPALTRALRVGPQSAGAVPGPAAYGRGGEEPTVTDANVVLGYLPTGLAGGEISLDARPRPRRWDDRRRDGPAAVEAAARASWTSSTRTCSARSGSSPSSRATTRVTSRSSPSAAPARCTPTPSAS